MATIIAAALAMNTVIKQLLDLNKNDANFFVPQTPVGNKLDLESEAVIVDGGVVDGELHGEVPLGTGAAVFVDGGLVSVVVQEVAGDGNDGVNVHFIHEIDVFEIMGFDDSDMQWPNLHFRNWILGETTMEGKEDEEILVGIFEDFKDFV